MLQSETSGFVTFSKLPSPIYKIEMIKLTLLTLRGAVVPKDNKKKVIPGETFHIKEK